MADPIYRGRFAPSPTGPLHMGSLVAAVGSYLDARTQGGQWLVRMEDVDTPRNVPGADTHILRTLEAFGFEWDGQVVWQSQRLEAYQAALDTLVAAGDAYPCACSRKEIAERSPLPAVDGGMVYSGHCRAGLAPGKTPRAWRLKVEDAPITLTDRLQGEMTQVLSRDVGDFVLRRADGLFAYQLAVVVDDAWQGITQVVRGADLVASTPRQVWLQSRLAYPMPTYAHLPVVTNGRGEKLSKQTLAPALDPAHAAEALVQALSFLGQELPAGLSRASLREVWGWAKAHWSFARIAPRGAA